jgi:hypothetical protein
MRGFAGFILVISILGCLLGLFALFGGGGAAMLGSGFTGILLSCVILVLVDIRTAVRSLAPKPEDGLMDND